MSLNSVIEKLDASMEEWLQTSRATVAIIIDNPNCTETTQHRARELMATIEETFDAYLQLIVRSADVEQFITDVQKTTVSIMRLGDDLQESRAA